MPQAKVFEVRQAFKPTVNNEADEPEPWNDSDEEDNGLINDGIPDIVPDLKGDVHFNDYLKHLYEKYHDFFDTRISDQLAPHRATDYAIELKPGTEPSYIHIYNLSPAELKVLDDYINEALAKGWIRESQSPAGAPVLFSPKKSR